MHKKHPPSLPSLVVLAPTVLPALLLTACPTPTPTPENDAGNHPENDSGAVVDEDSGVVETDGGGVVDPDGGSPNDGGVIAVNKLVINEISCATDPDYVEIYNGTNAAIEANQFALTDTPQDPSKLQALPNTIIEAGGFLAVDATQFGIRCGGDTVFLLHTDAAHADGFPNNIADAVAVPELTQDGTYGRFPDGSNALQEMAPTRSAANVLLPPIPADPSGTLFDDFQDVGSLHPSSLQQIDLTLDDAAYESLYFDNYTYVPATLRWSIPESDRNPVERDVALRIKSKIGSYRGLDGKSAFKVDVDKFSPNTNLFGLTKLTLNNQVQDPSKIHEWLAYRIFASQNIPTPRVAFLRINLNDDFYGLYLHVEDYDNDLWQSRHFVNTNHIYEGEYGQDLFFGSAETFDVDTGDEFDRSDLQAVIDAVDVSINAGDSSQFYETLDPLVDWDRILSFMAVENFIGHWDGYAPTRNNYFLHFGDDGMSLLPWGTDQTFDYPLGFEEGQGLLFQLCLADNAGEVSCRNEYVKAMQKLVDDMRALQEAGDLYADLRELAAYVTPLVRDDPRAESFFGDIEPLTENAIGFLNFRIDDISSQIGCLTAAVDNDGDGAICQFDCNDDDASIYVGAVDICGNNIDEDCNGRNDDAPECPDCQEVELRVDPEDSREEERTRHTYFFCFNSRTYEQAQNICDAVGARLLVINGPTEQSVVYEEAVVRLGREYWMGLDDIDEEGAFYWFDGRLSDEGYTNWSPGEPNNAGDEDCGHAWGFDGTWNDIPCDAAMSTVCERE